MLHNPGEHNQQHPRTLTQRLIDLILFPVAPLWTPTPFHPPPSIAHSLHSVHTSIFLHITSIQPLPIYLSSPGPLPLLRLSTRCHGTRSRNSAAETGDPPPAQRMAVYWAAAGKTSSFHLGWSVLVLGTERFDGGEERDGHMDCYRFARALLQRRPRQLGRRDCGASAARGGRVPIGCLVVAVPVPP